MTVLLVLLLSQYSASPGAFMASLLLLTSDNHLESFWGLD